MTRSSLPDPLQSLPPAVIDIRLQLPCNHGRDSQAQPHIAEQGIVSLLVQAQLSAMPQSRVRFAVFVEIRGQVPAAVLIVQVEDAAFADVEEEACVNAASI